jgi:ADP-heptose:LPS heptosyltransferase
MLTPGFYFPRAAEHPRRILVLHHLLLGDALMLTPLLAKLREQWPVAEIVLATPKALLPLYAARPFDVKAVAFDPRDPHTLPGLANGGAYDLAYIPAENRYSPLAKALGSRWIVAFDKDVPAWKNWLVNDRRPFPQSPATFGDFAAALVDGQASHPFAAEDWPLAPASDFELPVSPYAVLHLGASTPLKYWPADRWMALAEWLAAKGIQPIWSAGAKETALVKEVDPEERFPSFAGRLDLLQLAHLLKRARLLVCPDTGVAHLGRITDTPTVTLFGPGSPIICGAGEYWRNSPYRAVTIDIACRDQRVTFRRSAQWIRRCGRSYGGGPNQCANPLCMQGIALDEVRRACGEVMSLRA